MDIHKLDSFCDCMLTTDVQSDLAHHDRLEKELDAVTANARADSAFRTGKCVMCIKKHFM